MHKPIDIRTPRRITKMAKENINKEVFEINQAIETSAAAGSEYVHYTCNPAKYDAIINVFSAAGYRAGLFIGKVFISWSLDNTEGE